MSMISFFPIFFTYRNICSHQHCDHPLLDIDCLCEIILPWVSFSKYNPFLDSTKSSSFSTRALKVCFPKLSVGSFIIFALQTLPVFSHLEDLYSHQTHTSESSAHNSFIEIQLPLWHLHLVFLIDYVTSSCQMLNHSPIFFFWELYTLLLGAFISLGCYNKNVIG